MACVVFYFFKDKQADHNTQNDGAVVGDRLCIDSSVQSEQGIQDDDQRDE